MSFAIQEFIESHRDDIPTPYYLLDESRLLENMKKIQRVRELSGARSVLALKCFAAWSVFPLMREYMDGATSSSLFEARLGHEAFGKETHAYSVAWSDAEIDQVRAFATKIIFNSVSQLRRYREKVKGLPLGLRINPGMSYSHFDLADPARTNCRLGAARMEDVLSVAEYLSGVMFHCHCENDDFAAFQKITDHIGRTYGDLLRQLKWVSLGGGIYFTKEGYPLENFARVLKEFAQRYDVQVYLEPGEAAVTRAGFLVTRVLDVVPGDPDVAVVDAAVEPHMPDLLIYRTPAKMEPVPEGPHRYQVAGRTCLAGDIFGEYAFPAPLAVGSPLAFADAAGYTMVKKNWFNGVPMPAVVVRRLDGRVETVRRFAYEDFKAALS
jgi:carboxynorspermidine decarboxylase